VATLNSTGTPALFLHPVEAMHGDLGMVTSQDIVLALSNSGETGELTILLPSIRRIGAKFIAFTGNPESTLAKQSDIAIDVGVEKEACPWGMVPTASHRGPGRRDALAALIKQPVQPPGFRASPEALGALSVRVAEVMLTGDGSPGFSGPAVGEAIRKWTSRTWASPWWWKEKKSCGGS
jgi:arabinose-5-phosphate isomerase